MDIGIEEGLFVLLLNLLQHLQLLVKLLLMLIALPLDTL
jgi:hypothetical protein